MRPRLRYAVNSGCRVLQKSLEDASGADVEDSNHLGFDETTKRLDVERLIQVFFVGHSLGGMVALQTALVVAAHLGQMRFGSTKATVAGLCTLNGAVDHRQAEENPGAFEPLSDVQALLIAGDADAIVPPEATERLYRALPLSG